MALTKADVLNFGKNLSTTLDSLGSTLVKRTNEIDRDAVLNKYKNPDAIMKDINGVAKDPALIAAEVGNDMLSLSKNGFDKEASLLGDLYKTQIGFTANEQKNRALLQQINATNPGFFEKDIGNNKTVNEFNDYLSGKKMDLRYADLSHISASAMAYTKEDARPDKFIKIDRGDKYSLVYPNILDKNDRPIEVEYDKGEPPLRRTEVTTIGSRESTSQSSSKSTTSQLRWVADPNDPSYEIEMIIEFNPDGSKRSDTPTGQRRVFKR